MNIAVFITLAAYAVILYSIKMDIKRLVEKEKSHESEGRDRGVQETGS